MTNAPDMNDPPRVTYWEGQQKINTMTAWLSQLVPSIGAGVSFGECRYRVDDMWLNLDHHDGRIEQVGWHVFLKPVEEDDDRLRTLWPEHYK